VKKVKVMLGSTCRKVNLKYLNDAEYRRRSVGCLVLSRDKRIVLQLRDPDAPTFPSHLATFGGSIDEGEIPIEALVRELKEELGADVSSHDVITLGAITEPETNYRDLVYIYFWRDIYGGITGCYEGEAKYFNDPMIPQKHPKVMNDVIWVIQECNKLGLLK
jgi:8-oxo-dGTP diphosphatase